MDYFYLTRTFDNPSEPDEVGHCDAMVVYAADEASARELASKGRGLEDQDVWLNSERSECTPFSQCSFAGPCLVVRVPSMCTTNFIQRHVQPILMERWQAEVAARTARLTGNSNT